MSAAESSSRARQEAESEAEAEPPQRRWVALVSIPVILASGDERARSMLAHATNVELDLHDPPQPSYLLLHPSIVGLKPVAQQPSVYILATDGSGSLVFRVTNHGSNGPDEDDVMYFCDAHARRAISMPAVPYSDLRVEARPHRSIGLIADPDPCRLGHYLVAQLYPRDSVLLGDKLLCCSTATFQWFVKPLLTSATTRMRNPSADTGVVAHAGRLYWLALAYGVFVCDPFADTAHLRFLALPADCDLGEKPYRINRAYVAQCRRVAPSEGQLRYVEIRGLSYEAYVAPAVAPPPVHPTVWMWTLVDPEATEPWRFEYEAPFAEVWAHESYAAAGLPHGEVPHVALVDPDDHGIVYFFQGSKLFGLDVRARRVVSIEECSVRDDLKMKDWNSRPIVDAWEVPPPSPPCSELSSPSPQGSDGDLLALITAASCSNNRLLRFIC
ncbi:hypothetical protein Zm00014a_018036 [Zea mays]|uniref:DUF1618 domain-containing protein n=1 Tax=Zea mays TaxID=4577 RepID=A0A3L6FD30_MAIZE|nr:hypothetical protein Zm00014a_018036 [Zea mays]